MTQTTTASGRRLANQILDLIREAKFEPGHHLREQQLADMLGVSRTPVRTALKLLCELGIIDCLLYTSPSPRDAHESRMPSSA